MRDILFRGKSETGDWSYGYYAKRQFCRGGEQYRIISARLEHVFSHAVQRRNARQRTGRKGGILLRLTSRHKTALKLLFEGNYTIDEIAKIVKISRQTLYNWQNDEDFKAAMKELEDDFDRKTRSRIRALVRGALDRQEWILTESRNDNAAAVVAKDVLDR